MMHLLVHGKRKLIVLSCHNSGKSHGIGGLVNWFYETRDPSITLISSPNADQIKETVWKEVKKQRRALGEVKMQDLMPAAAKMGNTEDHFASGYTASGGAGFQGRKENNGIFLIFEEAAGIKAEIWDTTKGMLSGEDSYFLAVLNPTDLSCHAYILSQSDSYDVLEMSALEHPNVFRDIENILRDRAGLEKLPTAYPGATLDLKWVLDGIKEWSTPIKYEDRLPLDFHFCMSPFKPGEVIITGNKEDEFWFRPSPQGEARLLGRWPSQSDSSVWSSAMLHAAFRNSEYGYEPVPDEELENHPVEIGCDVAGGGQDYTVIIVRRGPAAVDHFRYNGKMSDEIAGILKDVARKWAVIADCKAEDILIKIDDDAIGGGVISHKGDFNFAGVKASHTAFDEEHYDNRRSEMWFSVAERANSFNLDLSRLVELNARNADTLRIQLTSPRYSMNGKGHRVVEKKSETKKRIKMSPDDADALNLAFAPPRNKDVKFTDDAVRLLQHWISGKG